MKNNHIKQKKKFHLETHIINTVKLFLHDRANLSETKPITC